MSHRGVTDGITGKVCSVSVLGGTHGKRRPPRGPPFEHPPSIVSATQLSDGLWIGELTPRATVSPWPGSFREHAWV